jgi:hypothetical protein
MACASFAKEGVSSVPVSVPRRAPHTKFQRAHKISQKIHEIAYFVIHNVIFACYHVGRKRGNAGATPHSQRSIKADATQARQTDIVTLHRSDNVNSLEHHRTRIAESLKTH